MTRVWNQAFALVFRWRYLAWKHRFQSDPWAGFTLFLIVAALLANAFFFWLVNAKYYALLRSHGFHPKAYAAPPLLFGLILAFGGVRIRYSSDLAHFWITATAPLPRWLRNFDRLVSIYVTIALLGTPPILAALILAGYPAWSLLPLLTFTGFLGTLAWPFAVLDYLIGALVGYLMGWLNGFLVQQLIQGGLQPLVYYDPERINAKLWTFVRPLLHFPLPQFLQNLLSQGPAFQLASAVVLVLVLFGAISRLSAEAKATGPALAAWRAASRLPGARGLVLEHLFHQLEPALMRLTAFVGFILGTRHYLGWSAPLGPSLWALAVLFWTPVLSRDTPLPGVLLANVTGDARPELLRAKIDAITLTALLILPWTVPLHGLLGLLAWLLLLRGLAKRLALLPGMILALLAFLGGGAVLWLLA